MIAARNVRSVQSTCMTPEDLSMAEQSMSYVAELVASSGFFGADVGKRCMMMTHFLLGQQPPVFL